MIETGQRAVGTAPSTLCVLPPGPSQLTLVNPGPGTAFIGAGTLTTVSAVNGCPLPSGGTPVSFTGFPGGQGTPFQVVATGTIPSLGFIISSASGGTGP